MTKDNSNLMVFVLVVVAIFGLIYLVANNSSDDIEVSQLTSYEYDFSDLAFETIGFEEGNTSNEIYTARTDELVLDMNFAEQLTEVNMSNIDAYELVLDVEIQSGNGVANTVLFEFILDGTYNVMMGNGGRPNIYSNYNYDILDETSLTASLYSDDAGIMVDMISDVTNVGSMIKVRHSLTLDEGVFTYEMIDMNSNTTMSTDVFAQADFLGVIGNLDLEEMALHMHNPQGVDVKISKLELII